jgi:hypothetical protein
MQINGQSHDLAIRLSVDGQDCNQDDYKNFISNPFRDVEKINELAQDCFTKLSQFNHGQYKLPQIGIQIQENQSKVIIAKDGFSGFQALKNPQKVEEELTVHPDLSGIYNEFDQYDAHQLTLEFHDDDFEDASISSKLKEPLVAVDLAPIKEKFSHLDEKQINWINQKFKAWKESKKYLVGSAVDTIDLFEKFYDRKKCNADKQILQALKEFKESWEQHARGDEGYGLQCFLYSIYNSLVEEESTENGFSLLIKELGAETVFLEILVNPLLREWGLEAISLNQRGSNEAAQPF